MNRKRVTWKSRYRAPRGSSVLNQEGKEVGIVVACYQEEADYYQIQADVDEAVVAEIEMLQVLPHCSMSTSIN